MLNQTKLYGRRQSRRIVTLLGAIILALIGLYLLQSHKFPQRLDYMAQDTLSLLSPAPEKAAGAPEIVIVLLGERSLRQVGQWPWPRSQHTALLQQLANASLVIFDVIMPERSTQNDDIAFAEAVRRHGRVLTALYVDGLDSSASLAYPYPELLEASAGFGAVNAVPDIDGIIRRSRMIWQAEGLALPALPLAAAQAIAQAEPVISSEDGENTLIWLDEGTAKQALRLPPVRLDATLAARFAPATPLKFDVYEYIDVSSGAVSPDHFKNTIVFVGASGAGVADLHRVPGGSFAPGTWIIAQTLDGLLSGRTLNDAQAQYWLLPALLLGLAALAAGGKVQIKTGVAVIIFISLGWVFVWGLLLWHWQLIIPLTVPCVVFLLLFVSSSFFRLALVERGLEASKLPLDEILLAPGSAGKSASEKKYGDYLEEVWPKINRLSGLLLLKARADANDAAVSACLAADDKNTAHGLLLIQNFSQRPPRHRMLIPLPFSAPGSGTNEYTLAAWDGTLNEDSLKSSAALVVSIAMQYTLMEEQQRRQNMLVSTIQAISGAIDAKDPVTSGHSQRVAELARDLAIWLEWPKNVADDMFLSGILHDVGKIGVPDSALNKAGKLSDEEFASMKTHPSKGYSIMLPIDTTEPIMRGILEHHERLDGKGYPDGLKGNEISDFAKILKIADVYDALVSKRQYKEAWPPEKACDLLYSQRGSEFDPHMTEVFLRHMAPPGWVPPQNSQA